MEQSAFKMGHYGVGVLWCVREHGLGTFITFNNERIAPPSTARILEEIDIEISDALHFATATDLQSLIRLLRMAKFEVSRLRQRPEYKDKS